MLNYTVITDEKWLEFVLEQVLSNALKYTRKGKIKIYMDPQSPKTLVIEDTGIGIAPEDLPRVFERGYTGYNGRTDKRSTGISVCTCADRSWTGFPTRSGSNRRWVWERGCILG